MNNDSTEIILALEVRLIHPHCATEARTDSIRRVRGLFACQLPCSSPRPGGSPLSLQLRQWEKRAHGGHPDLPALRVPSWEPLLWSCPQGLGGNLWGLTTGNLIGMKKGEVQLWDLIIKYDFFKTTMSNA